MKPKRSLRWITEFIEKHDRFILTAHETPDGDAVGSEIAMMRILRAIGKEVIVVNADPTPRNLMFLDPDSEIRILTDRSLLPPDIKRYALLVLDVGDPNNIGVVAKWILPHICAHFFVDHHERDDWDPQSNYVDRDSSSTCEIIFQIAKAMKIKIYMDTAVALFSGIVYDTGSFIYPKTSAATFRVASDLVKIGVSPNDIYSRLYEQKTTSFLVLQGDVLSTMEFRFNRQVAIQTMTKETIIKSGSAYEEGQQLINVPLSAEVVRVSVFFKENLEGLMRCSMRSKGNIDVAEIARRFNGGGHRTAAGFKLSAPLEVVREEVLQLLSPYFSQNSRQTPE